MSLSLTVDLVLHFQVIDKVQEEKSRAGMFYYSILFNKIVFLFQCTQHDGH